MITQDAIKRFHLRSRGRRRFRGDFHSVGNSGRACPNQATILFNHACVARLDRAELRVITDVRNGVTRTLDQIDEKFAGPGFLNDTINLHINHGLSSKRPRHHPSSKMGRHRAASS
jgi:hypothetical protein